MTWTYDHSLVSTGALYQVRTLIGDWSSGAQILQDEQINYALAQTAGTLQAAAYAARIAAANYASEADKQVGDLRISASQRMKQYYTLAEDLDRQVLEFVGIGPFVGGVSAAQVASQLSDADRVPPTFVVTDFEADTST